MKKLFLKISIENISGTSSSPCLYNSLVERILTLLTSISEASIEISNGFANATSETKVDTSACGTDSRSRRSIAGVVNTARDWLYTEVRACLCTCVRPVRSCLVAKCAQEMVLEESAQLF